MTVLFDPIIPTALLIVLIVLAGLTAGLFLLRSFASGLLRTCALATMIAFIANPQLTREERTPLPDIVLILKDISASQSLDQRLAINEQIETALTRRIQQNGETEIRTIEFGGEQETDIASAITNALAETPRAQLAGIFVVTDGQDTATFLDANIPGNTPATGTETRNLPAPIKSIAGEVPIHILLTGRDDEVDRKITLTNAPRYGIVNESVRVSFQIDDLGPDNREVGFTGNVPVTLRVDGVQILRQDVPVGRGIGFDVPLERPGELVIELEVDERPEELTTRNNIVVLPITAVRDRLRVLLISGEPNPGGRVWRNLLKSDPAIDMVHFTILRTLESIDATPANELALIPFPRDELFITKLREFDLIIFDRYTWRNQLKSYHFDNIARFVEEGGAMLVVSGVEYNGVLSLARRRNISFLLPALPTTGTLEQTYRPEITDIGKRHPVTADLPDEDYWGRWLRLIPTRVRNGVTLMTGPNNSPLLVLDRVKKGRIGMFQSDHIWLWGRGFDGGGPHAELLRRTAHWLMKEPQLEEEQLTLRSDGNDLIVERRTLGDEADPIMLTLPDGSVREITLSSEVIGNETVTGLLRTRLSDMPAGLYRAVSGELFAIGTVGLVAPPEMVNVVSEGRKLSPPAALSGGRVYRPRSGNRLNAMPSIRRLRNDNQRRDGMPVRSGPGWAGLIERRASALDGRTNQPLLPIWAWLALITAFVALAWGLESRQGNRIADTQAA